MDELDKLTFFELRHLVKKLDELEEIYMERYKRNEFESFKEDY